MARLFVQDDTIPEIPKKKRRGFKKIAWVWLVVCLIIIVFIAIGKKRGIDKENNMELVELLEMDNANILTQKVKYETFKKVDPDDTSDIFFEVVNPGDSKYEKGDLIKFGHRFFKEQQVEGKKFCVIETSSIEFHLKKKHVKESLLKRQ